MEYAPGMFDEQTDIIIGGIQFSDLFDLNELQKIQDLFSDATGVASIITRPDGTPITRPSNFCRLCNNIIRQTEKGLHNCFKSDAVIGRQSTSGPVIMPCLSGGLWDAGASITVGGQHVANWLIGQVRNQELDKEKILHYADEIGIERAVFMNALEEVPMMSLERFTKIAHMLYAFAAELSSKAYQTKKLEQFIGFRQQAEKSISRLESRFRALIENSTEGVVLVSAGGKFEYVSPTALRLFGYTSDDILHSDPDAMTHPEDLPMVLQTLNYLLQNPLKVPTIHYRFRHRDGRWIWIESTFGNMLHIPEINAIVINFRDISERKRSEKIQEIQYNIASAVVTSGNLEELLTIVRRELNQVIDTTNFFIALYDKQKDMLSKAIWVDEKDAYTRWKAENSLSGQVVRKARTILLNRQQIREFAGTENLNLIGTTAESWLGVPLWQSGQVAGVMVVQSYTDPQAYDKSSAALMELIAHELSIFIEKKKTEDELVRAKEKAEDSDRLKSTFLANMSHEIRTPMNAIIGFSGMIADSDHSQDERIKFANIVQSRSDDLMHIINDLLEISRIESGNATVVKGTVVLNDLIDDLESEFRRRILLNKAETIRLIADKPLDSAQTRILTDSYILKQVYSNLVENAIKYTDSGHIIFGYRPPENGTITCFVKDTGIGISPENQAVIFEHFRQADISDPHRYGGTGLGLAICKGSLELLGGTIWVESKPGAGSTFYFAFPFEPAPAQEHKPAPKGIQLKKTPGYSWKGKRLLIVEDESANMEFLMIILRNTGAETVGVTSGAELRKHYNSLHLFDLVLLDVRLPDANGWELASEIKAVRLDIPVIAQTAFAMSGDRRKSEEASCDNYISKPIAKHALLKMLDGYLDDGVNKSTIPA